VGSITHNCYCSWNWFHKISCQHMCRMHWNSSYTFLTKLNVLMVGNLHWILQEASSLELKNVSCVHLEKLGSIEGLTIFFLWIFHYMKLLIKVFFLLCSFFFCWTIYMELHANGFKILEFRRTGSLRQIESRKDFWRKGFVSTNV